MTLEEETCRESLKDRKPDDRTSVLLFDFELESSSTGKRMSRETYLSLLLFRQRINLSKSGESFLELGTKRCFLYFRLENGEFPLGTRTVTNPLVLSQEVNKSETNERRTEQKNQYGATGKLELKTALQPIAAFKWGRKKGKAKTSGTTVSRVETEYRLRAQITKDGPKWTVQADDERILEGGIQRYFLGEIKKSSTLCKIEAVFETSKNDLQIVDGNGILSKAATKHKLVKTLLLNRLNLDYLSMRKCYDVD